MLNKYIMLTNIVQIWHILLEIYKKIIVETTIIPRSIASWIKCGFDLTLELFTSKLLSVSDGRGNIIQISYAFNNKKHEEKPYLLKWIIWNLLNNKIICISKCHETWVAMTRVSCTDVSPWPG